MTGKDELHDLVNRIDKDAAGDVGTVELKLNAIGTDIRYSQRSASDESGRPSEH